MEEYQYSQVPIIFILRNINKQADAKLRQVQLSSGVAKLIIWIVKFLSNIYILRGLK